MKRMKIFKKPRYCYERSEEAIVILNLFQDLQSPDQVRNDTLRLPPFARSDENESVIAMNEVKKQSMMDCHASLAVTKRKCHFEEQSEEAIVILNLFQDLQSPDQVRNDTPKLPRSLWSLTMTVFRGALLFFILIFSFNWGTLQAAPIQVCFTPQQDCTSLIIKEINKAKETILVQAYSFTSHSIASALARAKSRGVNVRILLDKSHKKGTHSQKRYLMKAGVDLHIDSMPGIAHNKIIIIDHETVITGSFNFTNAAQKRNAENLMIVKDIEIAKTYEKNWMYRQSQATLLVNRQKENQKDFPNIPPDLYKQLQKYFNQIFKFCFSS